jgi:hypothetical protein
MMKKIYKYFVFAGLALIIVAAISCEKMDNEQVKVTYEVIGLQQEFDVSYVNENGTMITEQYDSTSLAHLFSSDPNWVWRKQFFADRGSVVYLYLRYSEDIGFPRFQVAIKLDDKKFREAYGYDKDWTSPKKPYQIIRQGTIPF